MSMPEVAVLRRGCPLWVHVAGGHSLLENQCFRAVPGTGLRWRKALLELESWGGVRECSACYNKGHNREDVHFKATWTFRSFADSQSK